MNTEDFNIIVGDQLDRVENMLVKKAGEYATGEDRLHNFRQAAHLGQESMRKALSGMMIKHTVSVYDMVEDHDTYTMDQWKEKITDHIAYLVLLLAVVVEGKNEAKVLASPTDKEALVSAFKNMSPEEIRDAFREANPLAEMDIDHPKPNYGVNPTEGISDLGEKELFTEDDRLKAEGDFNPHPLLPDATEWNIDPNIPDFLKPNSSRVISFGDNGPSSYHPDDINAPTTVMNTITKEENAN